MNKQTIPIVTAAMAMPFYDALLHQKFDPEPVLKSVGITIETLIKENSFISAQNWYDFAAASADLLDEPCLGYHIGTTAALKSLPNMRVLELPHATLGELLTALVIDVGRFSTLATYVLSTDGTSASLATQRVFVPSSPPAQIDGYFAGFMVRIMRLCSGSRWEPEDLTVQVCDPDAIPVGELPPSSIIAKDTQGACFSFPALWLLQRTDGALRQSKLEEISTSTNYVDTFRLMLDLHLDLPGLTLQRFAGLTGRSASSIKRSLAKHGTTYQTELDARRTSRAIFILESSNTEIQKIGAQLGYPSQPSFTRAFLRWTGIRPSECRRRSRLN